MSEVADYRCNFDVKSDLKPLTGDVRDQHQRPVCIVFSISDLNRISNSLREHLSVEYLCHTSAIRQPNWLPHHGFTYSSVSSALMEDGQPLEADYPFQPDNHSQPYTKPPNFSVKYFPNKKIELVTFDGSNTIKSALEEGKLVTLVIGISESFQQPIDGVVQDAEEIELEYLNALHAVTCCGYGICRDSGKSFYLIKNSWGKFWGVQGLCWVSEIFILRHCKSIIRVM